MRMKIFSILITAILCVTTQVFGQERVIDRKEFDDTYSNALKKAEKKVHRSTDESESVRGTNRSRVNRNSSVREWVPPDREHTTSTYGDGNTSHKYEAIRIGNKYWNRVDDGIWKINSGSGRGSGSGSGIDAREIERKTEYKVIVGSTRDGITVDHYQFRQTIRWQTPAGVFDEVTKTDFWLKKDGLPVRYEHDSNDALESSFNKTTTTWEYPAHIKIVPPDVYDKPEEGAGL